ncbi:glc operon protein GlcG [Paraburkholderia sp. GAS333]|uniref:GlcG/HbpS family heme-binding protein n=1 Tax=Paraburkholderia sp. GAS333 TaxID=3156279 RepID=UPI003D1F7486
MSKLAVSFLLTAVAFSVVGVAQAQPPLIATASVPDKLPYDIPYGPPLTLAQARKIIDAAEAEARRRHWQYAVAVVDSSGNLLSCDKMDDTQLSALAIAEAKARASAQFRRATQVMQDTVSNGATALLSIPGILAGEGGMPIVVEGKLVGAVGASGGAGVQDSVIAEAGAAAVSAAAK